MLRLKGYLQTAKAISALNILDKRQKEILPKNILRNLKRTSRSKSGNHIFESGAATVYQQASSNRNNPGGDIMDGGGPLVLTIESVKRFCQKLLLKVEADNLTSCKILWVNIVNKILPYQFIGWYWLC